MMPLRYYCLLTEELPVMEFCRSLSVGRAASLTACEKRHEIPENDIAKRLSVETCNISYYRFTISGT